MEAKRRGIDAEELTASPTFTPELGEVVAGKASGRADHEQITLFKSNGLAIQDENIWAATTAGASRYNTRTREWAIFTEKNAPMEEIWNYGAHYADGKVHLAVWGSGILEFDVETERWREYLDPDGEMEIDLYRDDGIVHVITTGVSPVANVFWVSTYFGCSRYDGRHWRGYYAHETGLPSDFGNAVKGRSNNEGWFATDRGLGDRSQDAPARRTQGRRPHPPLLWQADGSVGLINFRLGQSIEPQVDRGVPCCRGRRRQVRLLAAVLT